VSSAVDRIHVYGGLAAQAVSEHTELLTQWPIVELDPAGFAARLPDVEVLFCHAPPGGHWRCAVNLRLIQAVGVGLDRLLPAEGLPSGVVIANASSLSSQPMAEFAVAQLLAMVKRLGESAAHQQARTWQTTVPGNLAGRRVTVAGVGPVGRACACLLAPFGVRLTGVAKRAREVEGFDRVVGVDQLRATLEDTDDLILALPLMPSTERIIGAEELARLGEGAHVVNVARGALIDEAALETALRSGRLAGAALDTLSHEPPADDDPLWTCPNLLLSAHVSWTTPTYSRDLVQLLAENVKRVERGLAPRNLVDRALGYVV
jgi:phosphoglycerate dehydrogenase-like enzyme